MRTVMTTIVMLLAGSVAHGEPTPGRAALTPIPQAKLRFHGVVGQRIDANVRQWLVRAPAANPGMLAMFRLRDRQPKPNVVPWAGEFVGKYLLSAIEALRTSDDPELEKTVRAVIAELLASQAEDGYLGPFPKEARLLGNWDLWGHYHVLLALLTWHAETGDERALAACRKAGDLICRTFLDTGRRPVSVGSDEMNLAVIHALGRLYRVTGQPRYLAMMRMIEKDWEQAGDYFRAGLAGTEYYRTRRPRWESLHDLQGLVELHLITGDERYRRSFLHHWQSIRRWDRHNNGAFSSGEQATGNPYQPNAIETCCTVAWMAISVDALCLTGDPAVADELELSTLNGMLGAQHPSGSWCTYHTPMDGQREASHHAIVFQARAGTPDLNCCSVNGPRGLAMLSEWGLMQAKDGLVINYYGPIEAQARLADGTAVRVEQETGYPAEGTVRIRLHPEKPATFSVRLRVPGWSRQTTVQVAGGPAAPATPGSYLELRRLWKPGDEIRLDLDMRLRCESGDLEAFGKMSVCRGPLLLAYDQRLNTLDEAQLPVLEPAMLAGARVEAPPRDAEGERVGRFAPWVLVEIPVAKKGVLRLCDFATAGSSGCRYVSWLPARGIAPPPPVPDGPPDGASVPPGPLAFFWRRPATADTARTHTVVVSASPDMSSPVLEAAGARGHRLVLTAAQAAKLRPGADHYWKLIARNAFGVTESLAPAKRFRVDPSLPPLSANDLSEYGEGPGGILVRADLAGAPQPSYGKLLRAAGFQAAPRMPWR